MSLPPVVEVPAPRDEVEAPAVEAIVIRMGASRFAVDLASVAEVGRVPSLTRVPGLPGWLAGVANWRGRILPVLDLHQLLGVEGTGPGAQPRLLVLSSAGVVAGMVVDAVDGTTAYDDELAPFPAVLGPGAANLLGGQLPRTDGPVAVLDVAAVVRLRDQLPRGRRSA